MIVRIERAPLACRTEAGGDSEHQKGDEMTRCLKEYGAWVKKYGHLWSGDSHIERGIKTQKDALENRLYRLHEILGCNT